MDRHEHPHNLNIDLVVRFISCSNFIAVLSISLHFVKQMRSNQCRDFHINSKWSNRLTLVHNHLFCRSLCVPPDHKYITYKLDWIGSVEGRRRSGDNDMLMEPFTKRQKLFRYSFSLSCSLALLFENS